MTEKLVGMLMDSLHNSGGGQADELSMQPEFQKISVLLRMLLMCSFDNLINVEVFFPELIYFVSVTFAAGDWIQRVTVHRLLLNAAHSLFLLRADNQDSAASKGNLQFYLAELNSQVSPPLAQFSSCSHRESLRP